MKVWYDTLFGPRPTPSMCTHQAQSLISHLRVYPEFQQNFFKTPYVPDGCIYRATVLGREGHVTKVSFDTILSKQIFRKFLKLLQLNPKGKWTKTLFSAFWPKNRFEVHGNAINRFLRGLDLNWQVFSNFHI